LGSPPLGKDPIVEGRFDTLEPEIRVTQGFRAEYPDARVGILTLHGVTNPPSHPALLDERTDVEEQLRSRFAGLDRRALRGLEPLASYAAFYRRFGKSYHVQLQLESVVRTGTATASPSALVEAMFLAELRHLLLTAGHDLASLSGSVRVAVAEGRERYVRLDGREQVLKPGDMYIADEEGVLSSVIYGPDRRTRLRPETRAALYTVYAPEGVGREAVVAHLEDVRRLCLLVSPSAGTGRLATYPDD
jgi:DNA/RNA-binding domain of Phe-tRNA-synthetase-like protein